MRTPGSPSALTLWFAWASLPLLAQAYVLGPRHTKPCARTPHQSKAFFASNYDEVDTSTHLLHSDIEWRLRPPEGTSRLERLKVKLGANILRLEIKLKGDTLPPVLCPRGGRAVLEAYHSGKRIVELTSRLSYPTYYNCSCYCLSESGRRKKKIARFGFTTTRGPSSTESE